MSGESKYRDLWQSNATHQSEKDIIHGIIFVVDCSDKMRIKVAKSELDMNPLKHQHLQVNPFPVLR